MLAYPKYRTYYDSGFEWLGEIPEDWQIIRAKYVLKEIDERSRTGDEELLSVSHLTGVTPRSEKNVNMFLAEDYTGAKLCQPNDVVVNTMWAWMGALGVSQMEGLVSPSYGVYRPNEKVFPKFLGSLLRTPHYIAEYIRRSTGIHSSRLRLYPNQFLDIPVLLPPLDQQKSIVEFIDRKTSEIDQAIAQKQRLIKLLQEQKAILLNQAVTKGLNPKATMCDSYIDWIGEVPKHWGISRLKFQVERGSSISYGIVQPGDHFDDGVPFLQSTNISKETIDLNNLQRTKESIAKQYPRTSLKVGDVILGIRASVGASHVIEKDCEGFNLSRGIARIALDKGLNSYYLNWFLSSKATSDYWSYKSQGTTFIEVSIATVKNLPILVSPLEEQVEISERCNTISTEIQIITSKVKSEIDSLQELKDILIENLVTGKISI